MTPPTARPATIEDYLAALPADRREAIEALRAVINRHLPDGCEEGMQYGMPAWFVPHTVYPAGYHCDPTQPLPFVSVASQKSHIGLYMFCLYLDPELMSWFETEWRKTGSRWDAGKSCVRAKRLEDIPLELVGKAVRKVPVKTFIAGYEASKPASTRSRTKKTAGKKTTAKKTTGKKTTRKKATRSR